MKSARWLAMVLLATVATSATARADERITAILLSGAEASLIVDMNQTLHLRHMSATYEANPILGEYPSDGKVIAYFAATMVVAAAITYLLPKKLRALAPIAVLAIEIPTIGANFTPPRPRRFH